MADDMTNFPGALPDPRSDIDIEKDYMHGEVIPMAVPLQWNRDASGAPKYSVRDQDGSSSCVAQAGAKALEIITGTIQSAHPPYRRRGNYPNPGMWLQNYFDIMRHLGTTTDAIDPSQSLNEQQMNRDLSVEASFTSPLYIRIDPIDIDAIAMAIETQKHCIITVRSSMQEWNVVKPQVLAQPTTFGHAICATYYFTNENGKKCLVVDESWGLYNIRQRIITEDFLKERCNGAMYFIAQSPGPLPPKPHFTFNTPLTYGMTGSLGVKNLQDALKYFGHFPKEVPSTGNYFQITSKAVLAWQIANQVDSLTTLQALGGKSFGPKSIAVMNKALQ